MKRDRDGRLILAEFEEGDWSPCGRLRLTAVPPGEEEDTLSLHVYECEETRSRKGVASIDLDLERAEILLRHLDGWVRARRRDKRGLDCPLPESCDACVGEHSSPGDSDG